MDSIDLKQVAQVLFPECDLVWADHNHLLLTVFAKLLGLVIAIKQRMSYIDAATFNLCDQVHSIKH